jgi:hypothetical protein
MPDELCGMVVPSGSVTLPSCELMSTVTVTVVVALALPYWATTVAVPAMVPCGVNFPAPLMVPTV